MVKKFEDIFIRYDIIHERDGRTDRRTLHDGTGRTSIASRGNKSIKFVAIFYEIRYRFNLEISKMIHYAFAHSHALYGIEIYRNMYI